MRLSMVSRLAPDLRTIRLRPSLAHFCRIDMCRNIKTLAHFEPPATESEVRAAALQFVRKLSGTTRPSRANQAAFDRAVDEVAFAAQRLLASLETSAPPRDREAEARKAQERIRKRFS